MIDNFRNIIWALCTISFLASCHNESNNNDVSSVVPLHDCFYDIAGRSEGESYISVDSLIAQYPAELKAALNVNGFDSLTEDGVLKIADSPVVSVFTPDVYRLAPDNNTINAYLNFILKSADKQGLEFAQTHFATLVWGKPQSILFNDDAMLIALNHYLGADYPGYSGLDSYKRLTKTPDALPYDMAEALVAVNYPFEASDSSAVVNRIVYEGALVAARMAMVKDASLPDALGYTPEQLKAVQSHENEIWQRLLSKRILFDTDMTAAERLVMPAPCSALISQDCPGRVGRYIGYKIVRSYLDKHGDARLSDVLSPDFYNAPNPLELAL